MFKAQLALQDRRVLKAHLESLARRDQQAQLVLKVPREALARKEFKDLLASQGHRVRREVSGRKDLPGP